MDLKVVGVGELVVWVEKRRGSGSEVVCLKLRLWKECSLGSLRFGVVLFDGDIMGGVYVSYGYS